jgi:hypothetical protein
MKYLKYLYFLPVALLLLAAIAKLFVAGKTSGTIASHPLGDKVIPLALLELGCLCVYLIPKIWPVGFLLLTAYLGGAISATLVSGLGSPAVPCLTLALLWITTYFRHPALFTVNR